MYGMYKRQFYLFLAELNAMLRGGIVKRHHINSKGLWEYRIVDEFDDTLYKSKGLR